MSDSMKTVQRSRAGRARRASRRPRTRHMSTPSLRQLVQEAAVRRRRLVHVEVRGAPLERCTWRPGRDSKIVSARGRLETAPRVRVISSMTRSAREVPTTGARAGGATRAAPLIAEQRAQPSMSERRLDRLAARRTYAWRDPAPVDEREFVSWSRLDASRRRRRAHRIGGGSSSRTKRVSSSRSGSARAMPSPLRPPASSSSGRPAAAQRAARSAPPSARATRCSARRARVAPAERPHLSGFEATRR